MKIIEMTVQLEVPEEMDLLQAEKHSGEFLSQFEEICALKGYAIYDSFTEIDEV